MESCQEHEEGHRLVMLTQLNFKVVAVVLIFRLPL